MEGFNSAGDIVTTDNHFPFCVEAKHHADLSVEFLLLSDKTPLRQWWEQAKTQTPPGLFPLLIFRKNHGKSYCMFSYDLFPDHSASIAELFKGKKRSTWINVDNATLNIVSLDDFLTIDPKVIALPGPTEVLP